MSDKLEIMKPEKNEITISQDVPVMDKLLQAAANGMPIETLEKFFDLAERNQKREAEKAFHKAFAEFKANPPKIVKDKLVDFSSAKGRTRYKQATIGAVVGAIIEGMSKHGLSHSWPLKQEGDKITVTCKITHEMGHSESTSLTAGVDLSGNKNAIQGIGSTVTYLERYTIQAITGIAVLEDDDDGKGHKPPNVDAAYFQTKLDKEITSAKGKEHAAISKFKAKNQKAIESLGDQDKKDTLAYIAAMEKEYPAPKKDRGNLDQWIAWVLSFKNCANVDVLIAEWDSKIKPIIGKMPPEHQEELVKAKIEVEQILTGNK